MTARKIFGVLSGIAFGGLLVPQAAQALPAFAAQTGQTCTACHIGGFGPQLTPLGRAFKIGGYTQTGGDGLRASRKEARRSSWRLSSGRTSASNFLRASRSSSVSSSSVR